MKVALPPPPPPPVQAPDVAEAKKKKKKKKKEKKEKKRKRSSSDDDHDDETENPPSPPNEEVEEEAEDNSKKKEKKKKKKEKKSKKQRKESSSPGQEQENNTPPATTPTPTPATTTLANANTTNADTLPGGNEDLAWRESQKRTDIKSGAFSKTELDTIRSSVITWAQARDLSTDDFSWIFAGTGQRSSDIRGLWKHVALALPRRTIKSVAEAGNRILHPNANKGKWTAEEDEELRSLVAERGNKWLEIGTSLGRPRDACRVRWREIKLGAQRNTGKWSEEEEEKLKLVVNEYLQAKKDAERSDMNNNSAIRVPTIVSMPANGSGGAGGGGAGASTSRGGGTPATTAAARTATTTSPSTSQKIDKRLILDDIDWSVVSDRVGTRSKQQCLDKWYDQLAPSMIVRGDWGEGDDRRLLRSLWRAGNVAEFEVAWDGLVAERTAQQARRRWRLMVKSVPDYKDLEFYQIVEQLVGKYLPQLMEKEPRSG